MTQDELKELIHYNPTDGVFIWLTRDPVRHFNHCKNPLRACLVWNTKYNGVVAGSILKGGRSRLVYWTVRIHNKAYLAHRLAWLYMTGEWPEDQIDHEDGDPLNNRWDNLRDVSNTENGRNSSLSRANTSGITGVTWVKKRQRWLARINVRGVVYNRYYVERWDAICARMSMNHTHGFHLNHGRR